MRNISKKKFYLITLGIVLFILLVSGVTYAYFTAVIKYQTKPTPVVVETSNMIISFKTVNELTYIGAIPGRPSLSDDPVAKTIDNKLSFTLTSHLDMNTSAKYNVYLVIDSNDETGATGDLTANDFTTNNLVYIMSQQREISNAATNNGTTGAVGSEYISDDAYIMDDIDGKGPEGIRKVGTIKTSLKAGERQLIATGEIGSHGSIDTWEFEMWLRETGGNQIDDQGKVLKAHIEVEPIEEPITYDKSLVIDYPNQRNINLTINKAIEVSEVKTEAYSYPITIKNIDNDNKYAKIKLTNLNVPTVVATYDLKWALYKGNDPIATGDFGGKTTGEIVMATNELIDSTTGSTYNLYIWLNETGLDQSTMINQTITAKIDVIGYGKPEETLASKILGNNNANVITTAPDLTYTSTDKGLYVQQGDVTKSEMGFPTYFYRGGDEGNYNKGIYNYVKFAGVTWRIVRINEDGSIKLISANAMSGPSTYNSTNKAHYVNENGTNSEIKTIVENWYNTNIKNNAIYDDKVVKSSFCNDISGIDFNDLSNKSTGAAYDRVYYGTLSGSYKYHEGSPNPIYICPPQGVKIYSKVGLITADELVYSKIGDTTSAIFSDSHLIAWTLTPARNSSQLIYMVEGLEPVTFPTCNVEYIDSCGGTVYPVVNLSPDVVVTDGDGSSASTAYVIE